MFPKLISKYLPRILHAPLLSIRTIVPYSSRKYNIMRFSTLKPVENNAFSKVDYLRECDNFFGSISEKLENMEEPKITDVSYTDGVLKVECLGGRTFVINRQVPNKQLWYSSPISGPARYEYDLKTRMWRSISKSQSLEEILFSEIDSLK